MKMPSEWLSDDLQHAFADAHAAKFAPFLLQASVLSLSGGFKPDHLLVRAELATDATEWRAAWVHGGAIGFVALTANVEGWGCYYEDANGVVEPSSAEAWVRPLSSVVRMSLVSPQCEVTWGGGNRFWCWSTATRVSFADGTYLDLPLFGRTADDAEEARVAALNDAIATSLAATS